MIVGFLLVTTCTLLVNGLDECLTDKECIQFCSTRTSSDPKIKYSGGRCVHDELGKSCVCVTTQRCVGVASWCDSGCKEQFGSAYTGRCSPEGDCKCKPGKCIGLPQWCVDSCKKSFGPSSQAKCSPEGDCKCFDQCTSESCKKQCVEFGAKWHGFCTSNSTCECLSQCATTSCRTHCINTGYSAGACRGYNPAEQRCVCA